MRPPASLSSLFPQRSRATTLAVLLSICSVAMPAALTGCTSSSPDPALDAAAYPPDFTLAFFVEAASESTHPRDRQAQHLVTPDRTLRAALGPGVTARLYPPATATLTTAQMAELYQLAHKTFAAEAALPPTSRAARPRVRYRLSLGTHGRTAELWTTPDRNPAAGELLDLLIRLRGGR